MLFNPFLQKKCLPLSLHLHKRNWFFSVSVGIFNFFGDPVIFVILSFFLQNSFVLFLSFSRHVTNLCGDLPRSAICKLEHSSYEKLFLRKFRNQKKTSKIPLLLEERACFWLLLVFIWKFLVFSISIRKLNSTKGQFRLHDQRERPGKKNGGGQWTIQKSKSKIKCRYKMTISTILFSKDALKRHHVYSRNNDL